METRSAKRRKLMSMSLHNIEDEGLKKDRISDLPDHIIHIILLFLPIKSAAKTSALSRRWSNVFSSIPDLDFTTINNPLSKTSQSEDMLLTDYRMLDLDIWDKNPIELNFITHVLSFREKHSSIRTLKFKGICTLQNLSKIIRYASQHDIRELDVDVKSHDYFNFPRSIINCVSLRVLRLRSSFPGIRLPNSLIKFGGFRSIHTLTLSLILFDYQPAAHFFSDLLFPYMKKLFLDSCPGLLDLKVGFSRLEQLFIRRCYPKVLDIVGPKLECLKVNACFNKYNMNSCVTIDAPIMKSLDWVHNVVNYTTFLVKSTFLDEAVIDLLLLNFNNDIEPAKGLCLSKMMNALSHAKALTFRARSIEVLSKKGVETLLVNKFERLRNLEIETELDPFNGYNKFPAMATLFENSPYLDTLVITTIKKFDKKSKSHNYDDLSSDYKYWEDHASKMSSFLNHLTTVKFNEFIDYDKVVGLTKFLMKYGNILENVILCLPPSKRNQLPRRKRIEYSLMKFPRASPKLRIVFE